jgi:hypothetical protein
MEKHKDITKKDYQDNQRRMGVSTILSIISLVGFVCIMLYYLTEQNNSEKSKSSVNDIEVSIPSGFYEVTNSITLTHEDGVKSQVEFDIKICGLKNTEDKRNADEYVFDINHALLSLAREYDAEKYREFSMAATDSLIKIREAFNNKFGPKLSVYYSTPKFECKKYSHLIQEQEHIRLIEQKAIEIKARADIEALQLAEESERRLAIQQVKEEIETIKKVEAKKREKIEKALEKSIEERTKQEKALLIEYTDKKVERAKLQATRATYVVRMKHINEKIDDLEKLKKMIILVDSEKKLTTENKEHRISYEEAKMEYKRNGVYISAEDVIGLLNAEIDTLNIELHNINLEKIKAINEILTAE